MGRSINTNDTKKMILPFPSLSIALSARCLLVSNHRFPSPKQKTNIPRMEPSDLYIRPCVIFPTASPFGQFLSRCRRLLLLSHLCLADSFELTLPAKKN